MIKSELVFGGTITAILVILGQIGAFYLNYLAHGHITHDATLVWSGFTFLSLSICAGISLTQYAVKKGWLK